LADPDFEFTPLTEADLLLLMDWLNRPHLQKWWRSGEISLHEVRQEYLRRIAAEDDARPFIARFGDQPVGYIQYYLASKGDPDWWPNHPASGVLGIDQFLADGVRLGQGVGTAMVSAFVEFLFRDPEVTEIRVDPRPDNPRAIRCYEKVGFRRIRPITTPDGPAVMMVLKRPAT